MLFFARRAAICFCWVLCLGIPAAVFGQTNYYGANGTEYSIIGSLPGDQVFPDAALNSSGGFVVWQDNITDGNGWGVSARRLDGTLSGTLSTFRVNVQGTNDQENPRVVLLKNGGAVFAWQGGKESYQHIFARFLTPTNTWLSTNDILVDPGTITNTFYTTNVSIIVVTNYLHNRIIGYTTNTVTTVITNSSADLENFNINPAVAVLNNSNTVVVWGSFDQVSPGSLQDVYGQILSANGTKIGSPFLINQFTAFNQRTPAIAALPGGGFVVTWVSEQERSSAPDWGSNTVYYGASAVALPSVDIYARLYDSSGVAQGNEFLVNQDINPCANPAVAAASDGSFMVAWTAYDMANPTNSWDIYARSFTNSNGGAIVLVNTHVYGDQYVPRISAIGLDYLIAWTSLGQDGSREGVFGQSMHEGDLPVGGEFRVNTTTFGQQMEPVVASDGVEQFLVVWTGYSPGPASFDLYAQRYANAAAVLQPINSVFVYAPFTLSNGVYQPQLTVSWPALLGISVSNYEVYANGTNAPTALTTSNAWTMTVAYGLTTNSSNSFTVDYVTTDGRRSPMSPPAGGTTWSGLSWGGIPYEWMAAYFGGYFNGTYNTNFWPAPNALLAAGGPSVYQVFQSGGNPFNSSTWLKTTLSRTAQGMFLGWNTQPGFTYQVQITTDFVSWSNVGAPRFAAGSGDSIYVGGGSNSYYRVLLVR